MVVDGQVDEMGINFLFRQHRPDHYHWHAQSLVVTLIHLFFLLWLGSTNAKRET